MQNNPHAAHQQNRRVYDQLAQQRKALARPARDDDFLNPLQTIDPLGWLGSSIAGLRVLALAAGGGRQSGLYAAAGGKVTVVDISPEMLALDREVAAERGLDVQAILGSMDDLTMLAADSFDLVIQPVSTCYVPNVQEVFRQVARVLRCGGLYISQHKTPHSLQAEITPSGEGYRIVQPYYREGPLPVATEPSRLREKGALEYVHRWEQLLGGICRSGFVVEDVIEPKHAEQGAEQGSFGHRGGYIAPYVRIKARRVERAKRSVPRDSALWTPDS